MKADEVAIMQFGGDMAIRHFIILTYILFMFTRDMPGARQKPRWAYVQLVTWLRVLIYAKINLTYILAYDLYQLRRQKLKPQWHCYYDYQ